MTTPTPGQPLSEADVSPCTDCDDSGITHQTERACSCAAGDAYRPHAPVSRPGDGVEEPAVTNVWAETYCELTGKNPDGQQVTFVDGATVTTFRDMAKREIEAMLCAAPKAAVRAIAALTPPAEPVSRPAGEGEAVARIIRQHVKVDATGLAPAVASVLMVGIEEAADAIIALLSPAAPDAGGGERPHGYLVKDFADGWYWTPNAALECTDGALVWSIADDRYETEPPALQPGGER